MAVNNERIRSALRASGMKYYVLAELLGISDFSLSRKLRKELPDDEQERIISLIREHKCEPRKIRVELSAEDAARIREILDSVITESQPD